jgi:hypothetical protein
MAGMQMEIVITGVVIVYWVLVSLLVIGVLYRRRSRSMQRSAGLTAPSVSPPPRRASDPPAAPVEEIASQPFGTTRQVHAPDISPEVALRILSGEDPTSPKPAADSAATPSQRPPATPQS